MVPSPRHVAAAPENGRRLSVRRKQPTCIGTNGAGLCERAKRGSGSDVKNTASSFSVGLSTSAKLKKNGRYLGENSSRGEAREGSRNPRGAVIDGVDVIFDAK